MSISYEKTIWYNGGPAPLNATNLNKIETGIYDLAEAVKILEKTVGEEHSKAIVDLQGVDGDHATAISANTTNIKNLTTNLGTTNTQVGEHETRVGVLEATVGDSTTGLVKRVTTLETESATKVALKNATDRIGNLEATYASDTELLDVDTRLQADIDEVDERLKARISTAEQDIITLKNSTSSGASSWEDLAGKPSSFNPTAHADGSASTYGAATESLYGHVKISNGDVANTAHANGVAAGMDHSHSNYATKTEATATEAGLLSATDKAKLDKIDAEADKTVIVNNLTSDSVTAALSAAQGKALKTAIDSITGDIENLGGGDMMKAKYDTDNNGYVDNADNATKFDGHSISEFSMDGHKHEISNVNNLQTELNNKADKEHTHEYASRAFKSVVVGGAMITADNHEDSLTLVAGSNITLTGDDANDKITISATDTKYTAGTGLSLSENQFSNSGVRSITQDGTDGHKLTIDTGGTATTITIPDNNTDTKVTSESNHYTPSAAAGSALTADASSTISATWGSTALVTGVKIQRDSKGHVTGVTVDSIRMPSNPDTDTKYTLSSFGITATTKELNYVDGVTSNIQTQLNALSALLTWKTF